MEAISLYELNNRIKQTLKASFADSVWITAEITEVQLNRSGHCYLQLADKREQEDSIVATARGTIWAFTFRTLRPYFETTTGRQLEKGMKVLLNVEVVFHELYGYSLNIRDIDPTYTIGDLERKKREILAQLEADGVIDMNRELEFPVLPKTIAVISSPTAAGLGDFMNQLQTNPYGYRFQVKLFPAIMQGDKTTDSVIAALERIYEYESVFDVVVIIRGGGATSDLSGFDTYDLAANCAQFPLPVITGIGHERDDTVLDSVSHTRVKTPTAAAEFLINHLRNTAETLEDYASSILYAVTTRMEREKTRLTRLVERIPMQTRMRLREERYRQERVIRQMEVNLQSRLMRESHRLELVEKQLGSLLQKKLTEENHRLRFLEQQIKAASPEHLLKRGYSITLKEGKAVTDASCLKEGDKLVTRFAKGEVESIVITDK